MQETEYIKLEVPKNLLNGEESVSKTLDPGLEHFETYEKSFTMNSLQEEKKYWQNRVSAACRKLVTLQPKTEDDIIEAVNEVKACRWNRALVKEAHGYGNTPISADIYTREGCIDLQEPLFALQNRFGSKKQAKFKEVVRVLIEENREKKVATQGVLTGYNGQVKITLNLLKV